MDEQFQAPRPSSAVRPKPLQKFLKRGEGTQKRVFGSLLSISKAKQTDDSLHAHAPPKAPVSQQHWQQQPPPPDDELEELAELQAETTLVELEEAQRAGDLARKHSELLRTHFCNLLINTNPCNYQSCNVLNKFDCYVQAAVVVQNKINQRFD